MELKCLLMVIMHMIQKEAAGEKSEFSLLLMHAEDQLMTTETLKIVAEEFIELYSDKYHQ